MSSQLSLEEASAETFIDRSKAFEITVTLVVSPEAMDRLLPRNATPRSLQQGQLIAVGAGLYTMIEQLREMQREKPTVEELEAILNNVPASRRAENLKQAGRMAQIALTHLETAMLWAAQARDRTL